MRPSGVASVTVTLVLFGCSSSSESVDRDSGPSPDVAIGTPDAPPDAGPDAPPPGFCAVEGLPERAFSAGPYGSKRHDVADDFSLLLVDGSTWTLSEQWTGCESYLFVPDTLPTSDVDATSLWEYPDDLGQLVAESPRNVHYFFVSRRSNDGLADDATSAQATRIDDFLATLPAADAAHWQERLHVVKTRAGAMDDWVGPVLTSGIGVLGFAIDRLQTLRGIGSLADVNRYNGLPDPYWPWTNNLAYVAHETRRYNYEATRQDRLDAENATVVTVLDGDVVAGDTDVAVELPSAGEMASFDTLEIDVTMRCPDSQAVEVANGNCGPWDYKSYVYVDDGAGGFIEMARVITTYHREAHWVVDATPMLVFLSDGGTRTFRWSNSQATATGLQLRFSNRGKGYQPYEATFLWSGGAFNSGYNAAHPPIDVPIPSDATRVELFAIITGHGPSGTATNCAEFCNHQHEFTVNGIVHLKEHPEAQTDEGCIGQIENGMTANQWGTWFFGRGGWCPGMQVDPWVVDVTNEVTPGDTATVSYRGLLFGSDPPDTPGDITMVSYLVFYR